MKFLFLGHFFSKGCHSWDNDMEPTPSDLLHPKFSCGEVSFLIVSLHFRMIQFEKCTHFEHFSALRKSWLSSVFVLYEWPKPHSWASIRGQDKSINTPNMHGCMCFASKTGSHKMRITIDYDKCIFVCIIHIQTQRLPLLWKVELLLQYIYPLESRKEKPEEVFLLFNGIQQMKNHLFAVCSM